MADVPRYSDSKGDDAGVVAGVGPDRGSTATYPGTPRWVKVAGIIAFVLLLLVVILMFVGGGRHGPGRHMPSGGAGVHTPPIALGVQQA
jgi:hypothetical protein